MKTIAIEGYGITSFNVSKITPSEMDDIIEVADKVDSILVNHKIAAVTSDKKKEYISDDDLELISAILHTISKGATKRPKNSFREFIAEMQRVEGQTKLSALQHHTLTPHPTCPKLSAQ